jgi:hypothetical protein
MPHQRHYSPRVCRFLVSVLYHEAKRRNIPMTKLTDELLRQQLLRFRALLTDVLVSYDFNYVEFLTS